MTPKHWTIVCKEWDSTNAIPGVPSNTCDKQRVLSPIYDLFMLLFFCLPSCLVAAFQVNLGDGTCLQVAHQRGGNGRRRLHACELAHMHTKGVWGFGGSVFFCGSPTNLSAEPCGLNDQELRCHQLIPYVSGQVRRVSEMRQVSEIL